MSGLMNWHDTMKSTAIAALAERTTTAPRLAVDTPWSWNAHDVWLTRAKPPRGITIPSAPSVPTTQPRQGPALHD